MGDNGNPFLDRKTKKSKKYSVLGDDGYYYPKNALQSYFIEAPRLSFWYGHTGVVNSYSVIVEVYAL